MGGVLSLGYDVQDRKLIINPEESKIVRLMFRRYLELGSRRLLQQEMIRKNIRSKARKSAARSGGQFMSRGAIYKLLSNPIYIGQIQHKGVCHPGMHEAIIDQALWDQVQQHLAGNSVESKRSSRKTDPSPLTGKLFDVSGERLGPSHSVRNGRRYRYYVSQSLLTNTKENSINGWRLPTQEIEQTIVQAAKNILSDRVAITNALQEVKIASHQIPSVIHTANEMCNKSDTDTIIQWIERVELRQDGIRIKLLLTSFMPEGSNKSPSIIIHDVPMQMKRRGREMRLIIGDTGPARTDYRMIKTICFARECFQNLFSGRAKNIAEIASREGMNRSDINRRLSLAFLSPEILDAIARGK